MANDPIFLLGVGAQKCGTSWLYKQLAAHQEIMMSPIKEIHYWDRRFHPDFFRPLNTVGIVERLLKQKGNRLIASEAFERVAMDCGDEYYLAFFRKRLRSHHRVVGEITPSYSILTEKELSHIREFLPFRTKTVFLMRDPVERMWSQCKMEAMKSVNRGGSSNAYDLFSESIVKPKYFERSKYSSTVKNLLAAFPEEDVFFGFYEDLFNQAEVNRLAEFLELEKLEFHLSDNPNKSEDILRPAKAEWDDVRAGLSEVYDFVLTMFGDRVPTAWRS